MKIRTKLKMTATIAIAAAALLAMAMIPSSGLSGENDLLGALTPLKWLICCAIGFMLLVVAGSHFFMIRVVLDRLSTLEKVALDLASGKADRQIDEDVDDEIGAMSTALAGVAKKWKAALNRADGLERLLNERTSKLVRTNERLKGEILERRIAEKVASDRLEFDRLSYEMVSKVIASHGEDLDDVVQEALRRMSLLFDADSVFLGKITHDGKVLPSSRVWVSKHFDGERFLETVRDGTYPVLASKLLREGFLIWRSRADFPDWAEESRLLSRLGVEAAAIVMLQSDGTAVHTIGMDSLRGEINWPDNIVERLRFIGKTLQNAMERRRAETALQESERRFRMIVEQAGESFFVLDYDGRISDVNRHASESLGYSREELLNMTISDVDIEVDTKGHKKLYWERLVPGAYITFEGLHRRKDGNTFPVGVRLGRVDIGENRFFLALVRDISERKQKQEKLQKAFAEIKALKDQLEQENINLRKEIETEYRNGDIVGKSEGIKSVIRLAEQVGKDDTCVLILGETGTGKELMAHAIHKMSLRCERTMVRVNCAALPSTLIESELFGREKGAYTGALTRQIGRFEAANGSTIFLDEIGDLPMEMQVKLLRVLQDGQFERLGSMTTISADVRIIAATNRDLPQLIREGKFRNDLYYRLNVFPITMPPLRDRKEDIPLLVWEFVKEFGKKRGKMIDVIPKRTMDLLQGYSWPGNIRELKNVIERGLILGTGSKLYIDHLDVEEDEASDQMTLDATSRKHISKVLEKTGWQIYGKRGAARILGLKPSTLQYKMKKLNIEKPNSN